MLSPGRIIFTVFAALLAIAFFGVLIGFCLRLREMRHETAQGKQVRWYKQPTLLLSIGLLLLLTGELINIAMSTHILPENLFLYILVGLLSVAALSLMIYSFKLSWGQIKSRL